MVYGHLWREVLLLMKNVDYHLPRILLMMIVEMELDVEKSHPMRLLNDPKNLHVFVVAAVVVVVVVVVVVLVHAEIKYKTSEEKYFFCFT
jgi:hypothetical protein